MRRYGMLAVVGLWSTLLLQGAQYQIDPSHSSAGFAVRHMMVSNVRGQINGISGTVNYDPDKPAETQISATLDVNTISTGNAKRDQDLKGAEFFETSKFPTIKFQSKSAAPSSAGKLAVRGDLTLHGVTREVTLDVELPQGAEIKDDRGGFHVGATAATKINRKDFGLTWNKTIDSGGVVVSDEVTITLDIELVRRPPGAAGKS